jgi:2-polyprenyl-3-methyl-5-hydroxy-6-metoxy-1,4-benzoquinol methylase
MSRVRVQWNMFLRELAVRPSVASRWDFAYRPMIEFFGPYLPGKGRVIDIGCGEGVLSLFLAYLGHRVTAFDRSARQIAQNAARAEKSGLTGVHFEALDFRDFDPSGIEPGDLVICTDVLEHFDDPEPAIRKVVRCMKPDGMLFLSLPSPSAPIHRFRMRVFGVDRFDIAVHHKRRYTVAETRGYVNSAGLKLVEVREVEGFLKNFFYVTAVGRWLQRFNRGKMRDVLLALDRYALRMAGGSGHYAVARRRGELT